MNRFASYFLGLILLSFGVVIAVKSNYGVTVSTSPSYVLSLRIKAISFGTLNYIVQGIVFLLMILILRKFQVSYFLSFLTSIILGYCIDIFSYILSDFNVLSHFFRITCFVFSILVIGLGLVFFIKSKQSILPFDMFVREVSAKYNIRIGKFKTYFDICILLISITLSFVFFRKLKGIHIGTLISALTIGSVVDIFMKIFDNFFIIKCADNDITS